MTWAFPIQYDAPWGVLQVQLSINPCCDEDQSSHQIGWSAAGASI